MHFLPRDFLTAGSILLVASCSSQRSTKSPEVITHSTAPIPNASLVDLYYEGQLCHWVRNMHQDQRGALWFGTNHYGVIRYANDTLEYFADSAGITCGRINGIVEDAHGNLWLGTDGAGLFKYDPKADSSAPRHGFTQYATEEGLPDLAIWSMAMGRDGVLWIGTMTGLCTFDTSAPHRAGGPTFTSIPLPDATAAISAVMLSPTRITCILEDRNGDIWFGRDGDGLYRYDRRAAEGARTDIFSHFTTEQGLCDDSVAGLLEDRAGNLWIGTMFGGISRYSPSTTLTTGSKAFTNFTKDGVIEGVEIAGLFEDRKGDIWFAAENHGVYRYDGSTFTRYGEQDGLHTNGIYSILEDREGRFWAGGWKGLFRFDGKRFFPVGKQGPWEAK